MMSDLISLIIYPLLYLDPGSGSVLVQVILATLLGIGVAVRMFWTKISSFFGAGKGITNQAIEEEDDE